MDPLTERVGCCRPEEECFEPPGADVDEDLFCTPRCPEGPEQYQCLDDGFPMGHCCDAGNEEDCCGDGCCNPDAASRKGGAAALAGIPDALVAIGAVGDLARLAHAHIESPPRDAAYRLAVRVPRIALRPVRSGPGLDAASARARTQMLIAEARAWALIYAAGIARARSLTAIKAKNMAAARTQAVASAAFAARAAKPLRPIPRLRTAALAALRRGGAAEVSVTANQVRAFQGIVTRTGLPTDLRARLSQLGLGAAERRRVAKLIVARKGDAHSANVLIEPLADASTQAAIRRMAKQLRRIAAASRRRPIGSSKPRPRRVRASRPHTSRAAGPRRRL